MFALLVLYAAMTAALAALGFHNVDLVSRVLNDPATYATSHVSYTTGWGSTLGVLGWAVAASVSLFGALATFTLGTPRGRQWRWLFAFGVITVVLLLDDAFLIHDGLIGESPAGKTGEYATLAFYWIAVAATICVFRSEVLTTEWGLLTVAVTFFGISVLADVITSETLGITKASTLIEDGAKLLAIIAWAVYAVATTAAMTFAPIRQTTAPGVSEQRCN